MSGERDAEARRRRLGEALRANLRRRKAQARARAADEEPPLRVESDREPPPEQDAGTGE